MGAGFSTSVVDDKVLKLSLVVEDSQSGFDCFPVLDAKRGKGYRSVSWCRLHGSGTLLRVMYSASIGICAPVPRRSRSLYLL